MWKMSDLRYPLRVLTKARTASRFSEDVAVRNAFRKIYRKGSWGGKGERFYSGSGSHDRTIVGPYVAAIESWTAAHHRKLDAVDLGCGDFSVGNRIRPLFGRYIACDVVPELIRYNARKYPGTGVDFRVLDLCSDDLPEGDVAMLRQVLQHLPNDLIARALPNLVARYRVLIVTEHVPSAPDFVPNIDNRNPQSIRLHNDSGVVLTEPPFDLRPVQERVLCEVPQFGGLIRTIAYRLY